MVLKWRIWKNYALGLGVVLSLILFAAGIGILNIPVLCRAETVAVGCPTGGPYVPDKNTVLLMHFDEGTGHPKDSSSFENDGTLKGDATWTGEGKFGGALNFAGVNGYVDAGNDDSLGLTGPLTIEAWVKPIATPGEDKGLLGRIGGIAGGYMLFYGSRNNPYAYMVTTDQGHHFIPSGIVFEEGEWQHVALTYDGISTVKWYLNGKNVEIETKPTSGKIVTVKNIRFIIGMYGNDRFYKGLMDEVRVSNIVREFTPTK